MPSETMLEKVPDTAEATPPRAVPVADPSSSAAEAPLPTSTPCEASQELSVSRPLVTSEAIWGAWATTPDTTSQIEPTTTAVRPSSTMSAPADRGTPRARSRSTRGANRAPSTAAMTRGTTNPDTCDRSHSTAPANPRTPRSNHDFSPHRTRPGDPTTDQLVARAAGMAWHLLLGVAADTVDVAPS